MQGHQRGDNEVLLVAEVLGTFPVALLSATT